MSKSIDLNRRSFLVSSVGLSLGVTALSSTARAELCVDPEELSSVDYQFRKYVEYTESSPHKDKVCAGCASFVPPPEGDCGTCRAVAGKINRNGHCTGWSAKK